MKKLFEILIYVSFFAAVVGFVIMIVAHFMDATPLNASARGVAGFTLLSLVWLIVFDIMQRRFSKE
jgi:hypothetical protein